MKKVIVRSRDAGVLYGKLVKVKGTTVTLKDAVQMWRWQAAEGGTLIDVASSGVNAAGCKFSVKSAKIKVLNACAVIDCTKKAYESLRSVEGGDWS